MTFSQPSLDCCSANKSTSVQLLTIRKKQFDDLLNQEDRCCDADDKKRLLLSSSSSSSSSSSKSSPPQADSCGLWRRRKFPFNVVGSDSSPPDTAAHSSFESQNVLSCSGESDESSNDFSTLQTGAAASSPLRHLLILRRKFLCEENGNNLTVEFNSNKSSPPHRFFGARNPPKTHPKKGSYYRNYKRERRRPSGLSTAKVGRWLEGAAMVLQNMFSALSFLQCRHDDDFADRMSYFYTSSFLIMMAVLVSFKQFGGRPLECWVPAEFTHSWEAYTEMYCWAQNTYFVPFEYDIPEEVGFRESLRISYYQWVPFFLLIQALLFYMPCLLWRLMNDKSGIRLHDIVSAATEKENIEPEFRANTIESLSRHVEACLKFQHALRNRTSSNMHRVFKCLNLRYYDSYVTGLYLMVKLLYIGNLFLNLLILNKFLETNDYGIYGLGVIQDLIDRKGWKDSGNFPRVTLCDFEVRVLGNMQRHTVQCVLVINIFNEKIFILLWLWFSFLLVVTILDSLYWFSISVRQTDRLRFILRHLELTEEPRAFKRRRMRSAVKLFLTSYIKVDGVLILRMLAVHAGVMFCTELTEALWHRFLAKAAAENPENETSSSAEMTDPDNNQDSENDSAGGGHVGLKEKVRHSLANPTFIRNLIQRRHASKSTEQSSSSGQRPAAENPLCLDDIDPLAAAAAAAERQIPDPVSIRKSSISANLQRLDSSNAAAFYQQQQEQQQQQQRRRQSSLIPSATHNHPRHPFQHIHSSTSQSSQSSQLLLKTTMASAPAPSYSPAAAAAAASIGGGGSRSGSRKLSKIRMQQQRNIDDKERKTFKEDKDEDDDNFCDRVFDDDETDDRYYCEQHDDANAAGSSSLIIVKDPSSSTLTGLPPMARKHSSTAAPAKKHSSSATKTPQPFNEGSLHQQTASAAAAAVQQSIQEPIKMPTSTTQRQQPVTMTTNNGGSGSTATNAFSKSSSYTSL